MTVLTPTQAAILKAMREGATLYVQYSGRGTPTSAHLNPGPAVHVQEVVGLQAANLIEADRQFEESRGYTRVYGLSGLGRFSLAASEKPL
ncbi:hypothetical protein [Deinococcus hopiensis]|uniref:Uncharacterized protein n=1 Tax=Deinococcus hopiensis KR-140 TaxID=695939 RepID=A0A1W1UN52_9DEIO|nr:hypothetical protein [Deinococcus hopiensis]SMB82517.1 hypothetical protein SAMN00790413_04044 [Deinococcus hopiensis KR-140]